MAANDARKYDIIVFGATGFTGEFVVEELTQVAGEKTWAVAGRNAMKIRETMNNVKERTGADKAFSPRQLAKYDANRNWP